MQVQLITHLRKDLLPNGLRASVLILIKLRQNQNQPLRRILSQNILHSAQKAHFILIQLAGRGVHEEDDVRLFHASERPLLRLRIHIQPRRVHQDVRPGVHVQIFRGGVRDAGPENLFLNGIRQHIQQRALPRLDDPPSDDTRLVMSKSVQIPQFLIFSLKMMESFIFCAAFLKFKILSA